MEAGHYNKQTMSLERQESLLNDWCAED
jgi:hypothetical protein